MAERGQAERGREEARATPMDAALRRRERRDAAAHRQCILTVARQLFERAGVAAVSMHQIAQAAGIGQGTLYRRYSNKADLCRDLIRERHARFATELQSWLEASTGSSALTRLEGVLARLLHFINASMPLLQAIVATELCDVMADEECDESIRRRRSPASQDHLFHWMHDLLAGLLVDAVAQGEIASLDTDYTADMMLVAMNPLHLRFLQAECGYTLERIVEGLRHIFITGIHTPADDRAR